MFGRKVINVKDQMIHVKSKQNNQKLREVFLMSKARKLLAVAVVCAMVFGMMIPAFALGSDVVGTEYETAAAKLGALEIMVGDAETGNFRPNDTIKRSEFAKVAVAALGLEDAAQLAMNATQFPDVVADHWARGYINVAVAQGIMIGDAEGTFRPDDTINYAEAITVIVRSLGYEPKAQVLGGFPSGYLSIAAEKDITESINVVSNLGAKRGDVALMVDASLDVPMMVQTSWGQDPEYKEDEDKTLLSEKLDVEEIEGVVTDIPKSASNLKDDEIKIDGETYNVGDIKIADVLLGVEVKALADDDDIFFISVETDEDDMIVDSLKENKSGNEFNLKLADDTYDVADDAAIYVNFEKVDEDEIKDIQDMTSGDKKGVYGYFVLDNNEIVSANLFDFERVYAGLVTEVDGNDIEIQRGANDLDLEDYEDGIHVYDKNFNAMTTDDIAVDSALYAWEDSSDDMIYLMVVNQTASGTLEEAKDNKIKVADTKYDINSSLATYSVNADADKENFSQAEDLEDLMGADVEVVMDVNNAALHVRGDVNATSDVMFGLYDNRDSSSFTNAVRIFTQEGEKVVYNLEKDADFDFVKDYDGAGTAFAEHDLMAYELNKDGEIADGKLYRFDGTNFVNRNDENLSEDYEVGANNNATAFDDDDDYITYGSDEKVYITDATIIFNIDSDNDAEVIEWAAIEDLSDSEVTDLANEVVIEEVKGLDAVVAKFNQIDTAATDSHYGVVTDNLWLKSEGWKVKVDTFEHGVKEYILADDADVNNMSDGDMIEFTLNSDNELVYVGKDGTTATVNDVDGKYMTFDGSTWYIVNDDTVAYLLEDDGDVDKELAHDELEANDSVKYYLNAKGDKIAAIVVLTEEEPGEDPPSEITMSLNNDTDTLTVTGLTYAADDSTYTVRISGDSMTGAIYTDSETLADADDTDLDFDVSAVTTTGVYKFEVYNVNDVNNAVAERTFFVN